MNAFLQLMISTISSTVFHLYKVAAIFTRRFVEAATNCALSFKVSQVMLLLLMPYICAKARQKALHWPEWPIVAKRELPFCLRD